MWKSAIVLEKGKNFENFQSFDPRLNSPFITGSDVTSEKVLLQHVDEIMVENNRFSFFTPNTVALLFSMAEKSGVEAMELLDQIKSRSKNGGHIDTYDRKVLIDDSKLVCEYLEKIQAAVVFSFTAIESFINISIPSEYVYQVKGLRRGQVVI
jgi:replication initiation and membrane attachment protein DnaB